MQKLKINIEWLPVFFRPMLITRVGLLVLGLLAASGGRTHAQETVPFAADVQSLQLQLSSGQIVTLKYSISGNNLFYFPVIGLKDARLLNGGASPLPFADANGNLLIPPATQPRTLCVTLYDYLKNVPIQNEILGNLRTNPLIVSVSPGPVPRAAAVEPGGIARLVVADPTAGNQRQVLSESLLTDSDWNPEPKASFALGANAQALLRSVGQARYVMVEVEQPYRAQFLTNDVMVNLDFVVSSLASTLRNLRSIPEGRSSIVLSSRLPLQLPPGGTVDLDSEFISRVSEAVRLNVYTRVGSTVDPQLVQTLINAALNRSSLQMEIAAAERDRAVATILLDDGLSLTLPLGRRGGL